MLLTYIPVVEEWAAAVPLLSALIFFLGWSVCAVLFGRHAPSLWGSRIGANTPALGRSHECYGPVERLMPKNGLKNRC